MGLNAIHASSLALDRPNDFTLTAKLTDNLYFVCEQITSPSQRVTLGWIDWKEYRETLKACVKNQESSALSWGQEDALDTFKLMLAHFSEEGYAGQLWMTYLTDIPYNVFQEKRNTGDHFPLEHIEMSMSLGVVEPTLYSPVGILRNPLYQGEIHKNISLLFHGAAAITMQAIYPEMQIMLTKPASSMRNILNQALENVDESLYCDQQKTTRHDEHLNWAQQTPIYPGQRTYHYNLHVSYGGNVLVRTTDETTRNHYDFLVAKMISTPFFGVAVSALNSLFEEEYEKLSTKIPYVDVQNRIAFFEELANQWS